ncbi:MAG: DEAD/DEAH box helicase [Euryarchaeota archaeon]|nr:DEAD/DEAH box helicase [Euryarchaeota archaeon]
MRCPSCGEEILVMRWGEEYGVVCLRCRIRARVRGGSEEEAYRKFVDSYRRGEAGVPPQVRREIEREGASFEELPPVLQRILRLRGIRLARYRLLREAGLEPGRRIEELGLRREILTYLRSRGIRRLYRFQEEALEKVLSGKSVVISAPTASGKTEAFTLPVVQRILEEGGRALFIYPTKALARDQLSKFKEVEAATGVRFAVLDGDTPREERRRIYDSPPEVVITNPDMLHLHMTMPWSEFRSLLEGVRFVVLDEIHEYTGAFGTSIHFILRRLRRFASFQLIGASATLANPREFASQLFACEVEAVVEYGRRGKLHLALLYPEEGSDTSLILAIMRELYAQELKTLVFANTHRNAEVLLRLAKKRGIKAEIHRAGLTKSHRLRVEQAFRRGALPCLIATPTLELGIDIGDLDAVVTMLTSFSRVLQRIGRAGRKGQESIALVVLRSNDPISSYYLEHPDDYFADVGEGYVEPRNEVVARYQLLAAALDMPIAEEEFLEFEPVLSQLLAEGLLVERRGRLYPDYSRARRALAEFSLRGLGEEVVIREGRRRIGTRSMPMAARELFPGAIYLHGGRAYISRSFHFSQGKGVAQVERYSGEENIKTEALRFSMPEVVEVLQRRSALGAELVYAKLRITEVVHGYIVKDILSERRLAQEELPEPIEYTFTTYGVAFRAPEPEPMPEPKSATLSHEELLAGTFHALEHVLIEGNNMLLGGGAGELGGIAMGGSGVIFIYDGSPGGNGLAKLLFDRFEAGVKRAREILRLCPCSRDDGCPRCTYSYQCGNNNRVLFKAGALAAAEAMLGGRAREIGEYEGERPYV